jgi:hypothetical protein
MGRDARRSRLEKQPTDLRRKICYFGDRTLATSDATIEKLELQGTRESWTTQINFTITQTVILGIILRDYLGAILRGRANAHFSSFSF